MACLTCEQTKLIPACTDTLTLGVIDFISTNVYIFVENITTGYQHRQDAVSNALGVVSVDLTLPNENFYSDSFSYEIWVTLRDVSQTEKLQITVAGGASFDCFDVSFEKINAATALTDYTSHVLQLGDSFTEVEELIHLESNGEYHLNDATPANVRLWLDRSGNDNDAFQTTTVNQPNLIAAVLNNQEIIRFNATRYFDMNNLTYAGTHFHLMALVNLTGVNATSFHGIFWHGGNDNSFYHAVHIDDASGELAYEWNNTNDGTPRNVQSEGIDLTTAGFSVVEVVRNADDIDLFLNGDKLQTTINVVGTEAIPTTFPVFTSAGSERTNIGLWWAATLPFGFVGDMRCIKIWDKVITTEQRQRDLLEMLAKI